MKLRTKFKIKDEFNYSRSKLIEFSKQAVCDEFYCNIENVKVYLSKSKNNGKWKIYQVQASYK